MTVYAFDIETYQWDTFLLGAATGDDGSVYTFRTPDSVADFYLATGPADTILSHNGGRFDFLFLLDAIKAPWLCTLAGSSIITMRAKGHAECRDTYRFAPISLADWTGAKSETGLPCICNQDCGGYCSFHPAMPESAYTKVMEYCVNDCRILLDVWQSYIARLESEGVAVCNDRGPRRTIGGIAWATIEALCPVGAAPDFEVYTAELQAYYGGRVECFRVRADAGHRHDVNSMYTWGLLQPMPFGAYRVLDRAPDALRAFARQRPGLYHAKVYTAPRRFAPLARRGEDGSIIWCTGHAQGWYAEPELRAAKERGSDVTILAARVWPRMREVFRPWVELGYGIRERAAGAGDEPMRKFAKWMLNAPTGKLAQGCETESLYVNPGIDKLSAWASLPDEHKPRWLGGDAYALTTRRDVPSSARPVWAAYLIAYARVRLLDRLDRAGEGAIYCDTDAVYAKEYDRKGEHAVKLGAWKYEGPMKDWHCLAPKLYRYTCTCGACKACAKKEGVNVKAKGIPRATDTVYTNLRRGGSAALDTGVEGVRRAYASSGRAFARKASTRALRADRRVSGLRWIRPDGSTIAPHRAQDGSYTWPGVATRPRDVTPRLKDGA